MYGRIGRGNARWRIYHGGFGPAVGSFEFTGENTQATAPAIATADPDLRKAARAFLRRVGS